MIRLDHRDPIPDNLHGAIMALGNFDGFHQGHQAVVGAAIEWARSENRPCIIATFDPHPVRHFLPSTEPFRLTTLDQRQELFTAAGADAMLVFHFDDMLARMEANVWVEKVLAGKVGAAGVVTGEDFTFGKGRGGNSAVLRELGSAFGIATRAIPAVHDEIGPISSSRIRDAIKAGDCETAGRLLTRPFAIRGVVEHGDKVGRKMGFPTANMGLGAYLRPRYGIYAVKGKLPDGRLVPGAANMGIRPTFNPPKELLEPHFFDFDEDLYDQEIEVEFHHFLRPEAKFSGLDELMAQIQRDCVKARQFFAAESGS